MKRDRPRISKQSGRYKQYRIQTGKSYKRFSPKGFEPHLQKFTVPKASVRLLIQPLFDK